MRIFYRGEDAFVRLQGTCFLCIGLKSEVEGASADQVAAMVAYAMALSAFREILSGAGFIKH